MKLLKIGHDASNDIVLQSNKVSALHAEITLLDNGDIQLEDKNSRNGTYIMNQRIQPGRSVKVRRGDAIRFADVELMWSQVPMPEDNSAYKAIYGIGNHFSNTIQLAGATVSRYHATIKHGRDGKWYIVDHSKNGTTVNGQRIPSNSPYRITRSSSIVCGGVPVNIKAVIPPTEWWKKALAIAASIVIICGIGLYYIPKIINKPFTDGELYAMYNKSVVYLEGIYHYHITGVPSNVLSDKLFVITHPIDVINNVPSDRKRRRLIRLSDCQDFIFVNDEILPLSVLKEWDIDQPSYTATGFFVSEDGKIITNLHVVKPWLFAEGESSNGRQSQVEKAETLFKQFFALQIGDSNREELAYLSQIKVEGILDGIAFIPQGSYYAVENAATCRVLSAGNDVSKDVALIQSQKAQLPPGARYVNVKDSIAIEDEAYKVGEHVYMIGFPAGRGLQDLNSESRMQVFGQGGDITKQDAEYEFSYNAAATGGASGSPVFNKYGMLIGVHHRGASQSLTQGYNLGIKAKYIKEIIDSPHKVK